MEIEKRMPNSPLPFEWWYSKSNYIVYAPERFTDGSPTGFTLFTANVHSYGVSGGDLDKVCRLIKSAPQLLKIVRGFGIQADVLKELEDIHFID